MLNATEQYQIYSVRLPVTLRQQLQRIAEVQDRTPANVVRRLIKLAYADLERQQAQDEVDT